MGKWVIQEFREIGLYEFATGDDFIQENNNKKAQGQAGAVSSSTCNRSRPSSGNAAAFFSFLSFLWCHKSCGAMGSLCSSHEHKPTRTPTNSHTLTQEGTCYQKLVPLAACQKKRAEANTNPL